MDEIRQLENNLDRLLPEDRLEGRPGGNLLSAAERWSRAVWAAAEEVGPVFIDDPDRVRGLDLARRPVFVCGAHRSGTSLVRDLCDGHPQLVVLPAEGSFFTATVPRLNELPAAERPGFMAREWLRRLANPSNQAPYWLLGRTTVDRSPYVAFARQFMAWWMILENEWCGGKTLFPLAAVALAYAFSQDGSGGRARATRWLEKTPTNERHLDLLLSEFPEAKVVQVVRHPAATYASRKALEQQVFGSLRSPRHVLKEISDSLRIAAERQPRVCEEEALLVRFEDVVAEPDRFADRLAEFLEIEPVAGLLCPTVAGKPAQSNSSFGRNRGFGSILSAPQNDPDRDLTLREQMLISAYTGGSAPQLGYSIKELPTVQKTWLKAGLAVGDLSHRLISRWIGGQMRDRGA